MRTFFILLAALPAAFGIARADQLPPVPEAVLRPDTTGQGFDYLWDGTTGSTYFVMGTADLTTWFYFNVMEQGDPDGHRFWFYSSSPHFFLKLRYTAGPTYPWNDSDDDRLTNAFELEYDLPMHLFPFNTALDPFNDDSDNDNIADGDEDPDGDGLSNFMEQKLGLNPVRADSDEDGTADGLEDSDQDGIGNLAELTASSPTDPAKADTDGDGIPDNEDADPNDPFVTGVVLAASQVLTPLQP